MTPAVVGALVAAGFVAVADWVAVSRDDAAFERLAKPAVIICLFAAVVLASPGTSVARWLLVIALAASLAGDWLLLPPGQFIAGLLAFLVAHLAYLALFLLGHVGRLEGQGAALGVAVALVVLALIGRPIVAGARRAGLLGPVVAYLAALCLMAIAATASGSTLAVTGAWLFVASDALLGWDRFAAPPAASAFEAIRRRLGVVVSYHWAQVLLTIAILGSHA